MWVIMPDHNSGVLIMSVKALHRKFTSLHVNAKHGMKPIQSKLVVHQRQPRCSPKDWRCWLDLLWLALTVCESKEKHLCLRPQAGLGRSAQDFVRHPRPSLIFIQNMLHAHLSLFRRLLITNSPWLSYMSIKCPPQITGIWTSCKVITVIFSEMAVDYCTIGSYKLATYLKTHELALQEPVS